MKTQQRTLAILKPDAVKKNATGDILNSIHANGFRIIGMRMLEINEEQAEGFYAVHAGKPFFTNLCHFMSSGPIIVLALEKETPSPTGANSWALRTQPTRKKAPSARNGLRASTTIPSMGLMRKTPPASS